MCVVKGNFVYITHRQKKTHELKFFFYMKEDFKRVVQDDFVSFISRRQTKSHDSSLIVEGDRVACCAGRLCADAIAGDWGDHHQHVTAAQQPHSQHLRLQQQGAKSLHDSSGWRG